MYFYIFYIIDTKKTHIINSLNLENVMGRPIHEISLA